MLEVRELTTVTELKSCEQIQKRVWVFDDVEVVPASHLRAVIHAGGLIAGASIDGELVGFLYGFPAHHPEHTPSVGLHSHMMAVLPETQQRGLGRALKWFQRAWCLQRGLNWISWTFDPLRARNARLNLEYLGATVVHYLVDVYGPLGGVLNAGMPSDRLLAWWDLGAPHVQELEITLTPRTPPSPDAPRALVRCADGSPSEPRLDLDAPQLWVDIAADLSELLKHDLPLAQRWRERVRSTMGHYFAHGYTATRFIEGSYLLEAADCQKLNPIFT